jgi:hypothetical protein
MRSKLLLLAALAFSCVCTAKPVSDEDIFKTECFTSGRVYLGMAHALRVCKDGEVAVDVLSDVGIKGLPSIRVFMDKKFTEALGAAHAAYGPSILQEYDTGYFPSETTQSFVYMVSRRISWWVFEPNKGRIRMSFYVILSVDIINRKVVVSEYKMVID